ncbi:MAG: PCRF domain-containing protein, partial [Myxococcales bacterium]|nr:PCRF domain-containing protein [Myxococcales bacterium]
MDDKLRNKLQDIAERHEELGEMLCAPEVVEDKARFLAASREHAELRPVAEAFARYLRAEEGLAEARELLADPDMRELAQDDVERLTGELGELQAQLQRALLPKDPNDSKNVVLEIRAGTGGEEAALFAADLWRMYSRFAELRGWKIEPLSFSEASAGGLKEVVGLIKGRDVYAM